MKHRSSSGRHSHLGTSICFSICCSSTCLRANRLRRSSVLILLTSSSRLHSSASGRCSVHQTVCPSARYTWRAAGVWTGLVQPLSRRAGETSGTLTYGLLFLLLFSSFSSSSFSSSSCSYSSYSSSSCYFFFSSSSSFSSSSYSSCSTSFSISSCRPVHLLLFFLLPNSSLPPQVPLPLPPASPAPPGESLHSAGVFAAAFTASIHHHSSRPLSLLRHSAALFKHALGSRANQRMEERKRSHSELHRWSFIIKEVKRRKKSSSSRSFHPVEQLHTFTSMTPTIKNCVSMMAFLEI